MRLQILLLSGLLGFLKLQAAPMVPVAPAMQPMSLYHIRGVESRVDSASYMHSRLHGRRMASLERYDETQMVAACRPPYKLGDTLEVTRLDNGRSVLVLCKDRFGRRDPKTRAVDLSKRAARKMKMLKDGVVAVRIRKLRP